MSIAEDDADVAGSFDQLVVGRDGLGFAGDFGQGVGGDGVALHGHGDAEGAGLDELCGIHAEAGG